jgi:hypothetical protein
MGGDPQLRDGEEDTGTMTDEDEDEEAVEVSPPYGSEEGGDGDGGDGGSSTIGGSGPALSSEMGREKD